MRHRKRGEAEHFLPMAVGDAPSDRATEIVADDVEAIETDRSRDGHHIGSQPPGIIRRHEERSRAGAVATLVESHDPVTGLDQAVEHRLPHDRGLGEAMEQNDALAIRIVEAGHAGAKLHAARPDADEPLARAIE